MQYFAERPDVSIHSVYTNNPKSGVISRAQKHKIKVVIFDKTQMYNTDVITEKLKNDGITLVILAGFLWLIPPRLLADFRDRVINIHPSILPKYGGKDMYGMHVHRAVSQSGDIETGITVHFVNEEFDKGKIISQVRCTITHDMTPEEIAEKVQKIEHRYFPLIIDQLLENKYYH